MNFAGGLSGGIFGVYNKLTKYKSLKAQENAEQGNLANSLNQANNNLAITKEQAPLVPQQAAEGFAARGVGQSTFGSGMGNEWGAGMNPPKQYQNTAGQPVYGPNDPNSGQPIGGGPNLAPGVSKYRMSDIKDVTPVQTSGEGQAIGTGLQRARDLASSMVSNATSSQRAAQNAMNQYKKVVKNNRHLFYSDLAQQWTNFIFSMAGAGGMG